MGPDTCHNKMENPGMTSPDKKLFDFSEGKYVAYATNMHDACAYRVEPLKDVSVAYLAGPDRMHGAPDGVANREIRFFETVCVRGRYLLRGSQFSVDTRS